MKLKARMLIAIVGTMLAMIVAMVSIIGVQSRGIVVKAGDNLAMTQAEKLAEGIEGTLNTAMDAARTMSSTLAGMRVKGALNRDGVNAMLKKVLEDNPSFAGTWTVWEPQAFDSRDRIYANTNGTDSTGRFIPYWYRSGDQIYMEALVGYDIPGDGDFYLLARDSGEDLVLNPYQYELNGKEVMFTSVVSPIKVGGKVVGVAGVDMTLEQLQTMMSEVKLYDTGYAYIVSEDTTIVTNPDQSVIGKKIDQLLSHEQVQKVRSVIESEEAEQTVGTIGSGKQKMSQYFQPLHIGESHWAVAVNVPSKEIAAESGRLIWIIILIALIGMLIVAAVVYFLTESIVKPIVGVVDMGGVMAGGDFTQQVPESMLARPDEVGAMAKALQHLSDALKQMIGQVNQNASQVAAAAEQISATTEQIASGSDTQANDTQTLSEMFTEFNNASNMVLKNAENASGISDQTLSIAKEGGKYIHRTIEDMKRVSDHMATLERDSVMIGDITEVIEDIADQTNLLALNAAIEAARAGDQGRGFAVVADEVRKLAERSAEATKQISDIVKQMQQNTTTTAQVVSNGVTQSAESEQAFTRIVEMVEENVAKVNEIAAASGEQTAQAGHMLHSIDLIAAASEEAAAASQQTAATSQSLARLAEELSTQVSRFRI